LEALVPGPDFQGRTPSPAQTRAAGLAILAAVILSSAHLAFPLVLACAHRKVGAYWPLAALSLSDAFEKWTAGVLALESLQC